ncbi:MAG TPA: 2Fe-2S iron-sulfur cluster-binding protein [Pseudomonas sp.]|jgi:2Fe-2S ferredoxin
MPIITFIEHNGTEHVVEATVGLSLMSAAVDNLVPGVLGDCGGSCACGTCHGYIDPHWAKYLPPPAGDETVMLPSVLDIQSNSRLLCQLNITEELDGLVVRLPESQG